MKKILFAALLLLSLMASLTLSGCSGGSDDINAGIAAGKEGDFDKAIGLFTKAIESGKLSQENLSIAYYNRGRARGEKGDYDKAIADFDKAIKINPTFAEAYGNRGNVWYLKGDYDKAIADYTKFIEINPRNADAYGNRGNVWGRKGDYSKAIADYTKAIEINPRDAVSYGSRGYAWGRKGDYGKAIADYTKAIEINPKYANAYNGLAWLLATCPESRYRDGKRAIEFAEKALTLVDAGSILDTLAAAYAEAGRFQDAIRTQEIAITKLKQEGGAQYLPQCEKHLSSYKAGKPWREK